MAKNKLTKKQIAAKAKAQAKKLTQGKVLKAHALLAHPLDMGMKAFAGEVTPETAALSSIAGFTGLALNTGDYNPKRYIAGYAPIADEIGYNKLAKILSVRQYPSLKADSLSSVIDNLTYHGATIFESQGKTGQEINRIATRNYHGVQLNGTSLGAEWMPLEPLIKSKGPFYLWSIVKKALRNNGININKILG